MREQTPLGSRPRSMISPMPMSPTITLHHVTKCFVRKRTLQNVTTTIRPGEFVAVIGRSGAGKTTLLRCLACSTSITEGSICFGDQDLANLQGSALRRHRARVGVIYQQFNLVKRLRVLDNVLIGRLPHLTGWRRWGAFCRYFDVTQQGTGRGAASTMWASSTACGNARIHFPAESSNVWPSPRSWRRSRKSSWPTSRSPASTS